MSAPCTTCSKSTTSPLNILLTCNQCERPYHHRCHRPVVTDKELMYIIHLFKSRPPDAPGPKRLEWTCKACNTKGKSAKVDSASAGSSHKVERVELASGSGSRFVSLPQEAPIELKLAEPTIVAPIKRPPTPIVIDDDSEDDIIILENPPRAPIASGSVQASRAAIPVDSNVPHPHPSTLSQPADNSSSKPERRPSPTALPSKTGSSASFSSGDVSSSRPSANVPLNPAQSSAKPLSRAPPPINDYARLSTTPVATKVALRKTVHQVSVMRAPIPTNLPTDHQYTGSLPKPMAMKVASKKTTQVSSVQSQITHAPTSPPHQVAKSTNSTATKGTQKITVQQDSLFLPSNSSDDASDSFSSILSKPAHKPARKPPPPRIPSTASSVTAALVPDFGELSVKTSYHHHSFDGDTDDDTDMLADGTGSERSNVKVKAEPTPMALPSTGGSGARRILLIPGWIEKQHVADDAIPDMWDRSAARAASVGTARRGRKDFQVVHVPSVVGGQADSAKGKKKERADAALVAKSRPTSEAPFFFSLGVWMQGKMG